MPFVRITVLAPVLESDQIDRLQRETKELMISIMRKPVDGIAILVERVTAGGWFIAGHKAATAAHVEAVIGRDTNSVSEKAQFIAGMTDVLHDVLGPRLADESYVVLHEIDREAYGRGGISRAERDRHQVGLTRI